MAQFAKRELRTLVFPIGEHEYTVPPVGIDEGLRLAEIFTETPDQLAKLKLGNIDLFKLAITPELWEQMRHDGVPLPDAWRVGMAALAHFQVLLSDSSPDAWDSAEKVAAAVWESGIDPKALAAYIVELGRTESGSGTKPSTRTAAARTARNTGSGTTTKNPSKSVSQKAASRSNGVRSVRSGR